MKINTFLHKNSEIYFYEFTYQSLIIQITRRKSNHVKVVI